MHEMGAIAEKQSIVSRGDLALGSCRFFASSASHLLVLCILLTLWDELRLS